MARAKLANRPQIVVQAHKLVDIAEQENVAYRTVQRRKDRFATVLIEAGTTKDKSGKAKPKFLKRYLDSKTTDLLRASGLFIG